MFSPSFLGLFFAGLCVQSVAFRKTWNNGSDKLDAAAPDGSNGNSKAEMAGTAAWNMAADAWKKASAAAAELTSGPEPMAESCSPQSNLQWQAMNFKLLEDKKNGHAYLKCKIGKQDQRFKVACLEEECKPDESPMPQLPQIGQREWCFVPNSCGRWGSGGCKPLEKKDIPSCDAPLIEEFAPTPQEAKKEVKLESKFGFTQGDEVKYSQFADDAETNEYSGRTGIVEGFVGDSITVNFGTGAPTFPHADLVKVACPSQCMDPKCTRGSRSNGGMPLFEGKKCIKFCSKEYKESKVRYCGDSDFYREGAFVDCGGCAYPDVGEQPPADRRPDGMQGQPDGLPGRDETAVEVVVGEDDAVEVVRVTPTQEQDEVHVAKPLPLEEDLPERNIPWEEPVVNVVPAALPEDIPTYPELTHELSAGLEEAQNLEDLEREPAITINAIGDDSTGVVTKPVVTKPVVTKPVVTKPVVPPKAVVKKPVVKKPVVKKPIDTTPQGSIRLAGENRKQREGRLEVYHSGQWGTICDNQFSMTGAEVVCKQLGYDGGDMVSSEDYGTAPGKTLLDEVDCSGHEKSMMQCSHSAFGITECDPADLVAVYCRGGPQLEEDKPPVVQEAEVEPEPAHVDEMMHYSAEEMAEIMVLAGVAQEKVLKENVAGSYKLPVQAKSHNGSPLSGAVFEAFDLQGDLIGRSEATKADGWTQLTVVDDMTFKVTAQGCNTAQEAWSLASKCFGTRDSCTILSVLNCNGRV